MRTTLDLDEDVLQAAKNLAEQRGQTAGQVISDLVRIALEPKAAGRIRNGVRIFTVKRGAKVPSLALVNKLRDGERSAAEVISRSARVLFDCKS